MKRMTHLCIGLGFLCTTAYGQITIETVAASDTTNTNYVQTMEDVFENVDLSLVPSGTLYERGISYIDFSSFTGSSDSVRSHIFSFSLAYASLTTMTVDSSIVLPDPITYRSALDTITSESAVILLAALHREYHTVSETAIDDSLFTVSGQNLADVPGRTESAYVKHEVFMIAPAVDYVNSNNCKLRLDSSLFFSNTGKTIASIELSTTGGSSYQNMTLGGDITIGSLSGGTTTVTIRMTYTDASVYYSSFDIRMKASSFTGELDTIPDFTHHIDALYSANPWDGVNGGDINVYLACGHDRIEKPFIWAEAYNPEVGAIPAGLSPSDIIERLSNEQTILFGDERNLLQYLRDNGYDIIILDYDKGGDYLPRTSEFIKEALRWINTQKHSAGSNAENVVIGQSMGGVCTSLALKEMEIADEDHEVGQFIVFDSPIMGANIPLSAQACLLDMATLWVNHPSPLKPPAFLFQYVSIIEDIVDILYLPATRTMIAFQCDDIYIGGFPAPFVFQNLFGKSTNSRYNTFYTNLHTTLGGMPNNCDILTITNGSRFGALGKQPYEAGELVVQSQIDNFVVASLISGWLSNAVLGTDLSLFEADEVYGGQGMLLWQSGFYVETNTRLYAMKNEPDFTYYKNSIFVSWDILDIPIIFHTNQAKTTGGIEIDHAPGGFFGIENQGIILDEATLGPLMPQVFKMQTWCFTPTGSVLNDHGPYGETWMDDPMRSYADVEDNLDDGYLRGVKSYLSNSETPDFGTETEYNNTAHTWFTNQNTRYVLYHLVGTDIINGETNLTTGEVFNYGASDIDDDTDFESSLPVRTSSVLNHSLDVTDALLGVNTNTVIGKTPSPYFPEILGNAQGLSHFLLHIGEQCDADDPVVLTLNNDGDMVLGDGATRNASVIIQDGHTIHIQDGGVLRVRKGSTLKLMNGATLIVDDGATLIIEDEGNLITEIGSTIEYFEGAETQLNGHSANMSLGGILHLNENADFHPTHVGVSSGNIVVRNPDGLIDAEPGSRFTLIGDNALDPLLTIYEGARLLAPADLELLSISHCAVAIRTLDYYPIQSFAPFHSFGTTYSLQSNLTELNFKAQIRLHNNSHISNSSFDNIILHAEEVTPTDGVFLRIHSTDFTADYEKSLVMCKILGGNVNMRFCNFHDFEGAALSMDDATRSSVIEYTTFEPDNGDYSLCIADRSSTETTVRYSTFSNSRGGVAKRTGKLTLKCNIFNNMGRSGVFVGSGAYLDMASTSNAGYNVFNNMDEYNVDAINAQSMLFRNGYNYFDEVSGAPTIHGTLQIGAYVTTYLLGQKNRWNVSNLEPDATKFDLENVETGNTIIMYAANPENANCGVKDPSEPVVDGGGAGTFLPVISFSGTTEVLRLDSAISFAQEKTKLWDETGSDLVALERFHDILTYPYSAQDLSNDTTLWYRDYAYQIMKSTLYNALGDSTIRHEHNNGQFSTEVDYYVDVLNELTKDSLAVSHTAYQRRFAYELDKAQLFRSFGHTATALAILDNIDWCDLDAPEQQSLNEWRFAYQEAHTKQLIGMDAYLRDTVYTDSSLFEKPLDRIIDTISFGSTITSMTSVQYRGCAPSSQSHTTENNNQPETLIERALASLRVYPNPTQGMARIEFTLPGASNGELIVHSLDGKRILSMPLSSGQNTHIIDLTFAQCGTYLYTLMIDGAPAHHGKLVKH